nr:phosphoglycerate dehydrogenase [Rhodococcus sp. (in: high G+C Gram-positive bacteria)]
MSTVVITTDYLIPGDSIDTMLRGAGHETVHRPAGVKRTEAERAALLRTADAALVASEPITSEMISEAVNLKVVARTGVGYDSVDVDAATARGIFVTNTPGANSNAVAEMTMMLVLMCARKARDTIFAVEQGDWPRHDTREIGGSTLGIIGLGPSGRRVAELAHAFGVDIVAHTAYPDRDFAAAYGLTYASLEETVARSDFLTLHPRPTAANVGLMDARLLGRMKPTAYLINTARGSLVDENALADALRCGVIAGAALDVVSHEPLTVESPLRGVANLVITSHLGGQTEQARATAALAATQDILRVLRGEPPRSAVNAPVH